MIGENAGMVMVAENSENAWQRGSIRQHQRNKYIGRNIKGGERRQLAYQIAGNGEISANAKAWRK